MAERRYRLRDGDTVYVYLTNLGDGIPHVGEQPLEPATVRGWWRYPAPAVTSYPAPAQKAALVVRWPPRRHVARYELIDLARRDRDYPEALTVGEFAERSDPDSVAYDSRAAAFYEPVYEYDDGKAEVVEGPWLDLAGAPPPDDGLTWVAQLPYELSYHDEYRHLFPGHLGGFRAAVVAALDALPFASAHGHGIGPVSVYVKLELPKPDPLTRYAASPFSQGMTRDERKRARARHEATVEKVTRHLEIPVPSRIEGRDRADATGRWHAALDQIVAYVAAVESKPCEHCHGRGWTEPLLATIDEGETT